MSAPDNLWAPTQSPQTMPDGPGESEEAYRAKLKRDITKADECIWTVSGGLLRASCDTQHRGHGRHYPTCLYCGKSVRLVDR